MKRKKIIKLSHERVVLSDTLPYETPVVFSNRFFYQLLVNYKIKLSENKITFQKNDLKIGEEEGLNSLLRILFSDKLEKVELITIPFCFRIKHKKDTFRELSLMHPIKQLELIEFYKQFNKLILYYCSISKFSIRKPVEIARFIYFNDNLNKINQGALSDTIEISEKEYPNLKTYFAYKSYSSIFKFYEDVKFHRAEKKFDHLLKFDITKCFDSIYTHSITWAVNGREVVKENVKLSQNTFAGKFDKFLQYANYAETNGILIGPEVSRIFAEIILQSIDNIVVNNLENKGLIHKVDYEVFRYVDDYFVFSNSQELSKKILLEFEHELKTFKLGVSEEKKEEFNRPIITWITIAKERLGTFYNEKFNIQVLPKDELLDSTKSRITDFRLNSMIRSSRLITEYKQIIKETNVEYKEVITYSLGILHNRVIEQINNCIDFYQNKITHKKKSEYEIWEIEEFRKIENVISSYLIEILDYTFFLYSVAPRVNSTITICQILSNIISFISNPIEVMIGEEEIKFNWLSNPLQDRIFKVINDECLFILGKNKVTKYSKIESMYLLCSLSELGKKYKLGEDDLINYLGCTKDNNNNWNFEQNSLNYFNIVVLLYYIKDSNNYEQLRIELKKYIISYISQVPLKKRQKSSEIAHLLTDLLFCPFLDKEFKKSLYLNYYEMKTIDEINRCVKDVDNILKFRKKQKYMFTKWENVNFVKEYFSKKSLEVYS